MPSIRKYNEYLEAENDTDHESPDYDSDAEAAEDSRTARLGNRKTKRQRLSLAESQDDQSEEDGFESNNEDDDRANGISLQSSRQVADKDNVNPQLQKESHNPATKKPPAKPAAAPAAPADSTKAPNQRPKKPSKPGILYLSRIPPYMSPHTVRHHLSPFGSITNLFLTPEPPAQRQARLARRSGNKKRTYVDGWVEFAHRRHAKACMAAINGNIVGGKKGGWYRDDVWSCRYLKGFGWGDLMEGVRREEREREERVRIGIGRDKREREAFLKGVEAAKGGFGRRKKGIRKDGGGGETGEGKRFRQSEVVGKGEDEDGQGQSEEVKRVLSKIF